MSAKAAYVEFEGVLTYDDGKLIWIKDVNSRVKAGSFAGRLRPDGYYHVTYRGKKYLLHRLVFFMHHGYWPDMVDHIDRDKSNNRIENLRDVSPYESAKNRYTFKNDLEGINYLRGKFQLIYRKEYIGRFNTLHEAIDMRNTIERPAT